MKRFGKFNKSFGENKEPNTNSTKDAEKNCNIASNIIGFFLTPKERTWTWNAHSNEPMITQISPLFIFSKIKLPSGTAKSIEPKIQITTAIQSEKWGKDPRNIPIIGTNKTYKLVKKPALVAVVVTRPICWNNAANPRNAPNAKP